MPMLPGRGWLLLAPALLAMLFAGCGGDGGDSGDSGADEAYVAAICKAFSQLNSDIDKVDVSNIKDPKDAAKQFGAAFETLATTFSDATPPRDLKDWHADATRVLTDAAKAMKDGDISALRDMVNLPEPPGPAGRLEKYARENKDCQEAEFGFGI